MFEQVLFRSEIGIYCFVAEMYEGLTAQGEKQKRLKIRKESGIGLFNLFFFNLLTPVGLDQNDAINTNSLLLHSVGVSF